PCGHAQIEIDRRRQHARRDDQVRHWVTPDPVDLSAEALHQCGPAGTKSLFLLSSQFVCTVTIVGFVMMSNTAERFWDWATSASMASREAWASMAKRTAIELNALRTSGSPPRIPRMFMLPSSVEVTLLSWIPRCCATAATPADRQPASADRTSSTGV